MKQISDELLDMLFRYFLEEQQDEEERIELYGRIRTELKKKQERERNRQNYSAICKAQTDKERHRAIDQYCDGQGIPTDFRYYERERRTE